MSSKIDQRIRIFTETVPISEFSSEDIFIVGYPKSGNTWFQNIFAGLIYNVNPGSTPDTIIQDLVPDVHYKRYYRRYSDQMYFKSHFFPRPDYKKVIYLVRDGRDVMVSYFHFLKALREKQGHSLSFHELFSRREGIFQKRLWHEHVDAWLANPYGSEMLIIKYEDTLVNFTGELEKICQFIDFEISRERLEQLRQQTSFNMIQSKEIKYGLNNPAWPREKLFARRGKAGSYQDEMPKEIQEHFLDYSSDTLRKLNYTL